MNQRYTVTPDVAEGVQKAHVWRCPVDGGVWLTKTCGFSAQDHERVTVIVTTEIVDGHV